MEKFFTDDIRKQITEILQQMVRPITIKLFVDEKGCQSCPETKQLLTEFKDTNPKIKLEVLDTNQHADQAKQYGISLIPSFVMLNDLGQYKGVSYCTTCDAPFFKDKHVVVAGGGNSAAEAVIDLAVWAKKITVVHRSQWRADKIILDQLSKLKHVTIHLETQLLRAEGNQTLNRVVVLDKKTNKQSTIEADGLFIQIGLLANSTLVKDLVALTPQGEVIVNQDFMTNIPGLFAAGDVTHHPFKQIVIAVGDGAKAALAIQQYLLHHS